MLKGKLLTLSQPLKHRPVRLAKCLTAGLGTVGTQNKKAGVMWLPP